MQSWHDPFVTEAKLTNILVTNCTSFKDFFAPALKVRYYFSVKLQEFKAKFYLP